LLVIGLVASWIVAGKLVAPQPRIIGEPPSGLPASSISFESNSGSTIAGWHVASDEAQGVIVLLHPIRGSRLSMLDRAHLLHSAGYSIVMIDLQAHGESPGDHITPGHLERHDVRAAVEFAREQHTDEPIGVLGVSLGGASALFASPLDVDALVLESVYPNIDDAVHNRVAARLGPLSTIPAKLLLVQLKPRLGISSSQLRPIDRLPNVECPVYVISGTEDKHTTVNETKQMFSVARQPKEMWLVEGAGHEDLYRVSPGEYKSRVLGFFKHHMGKVH
jgi:alpha-beta hydrolase superfamily lysophospholipase